MLSGDGDQEVQAIGHFKLGLNSEYRLFYAGLTTTSRGYVRGMVEALIATPCNETPHTWSIRFSVTMLLNTGYSRAQFNRRNRSSFLHGVCRFNAQ